MTVGCKKQQTVVVGMGTDGQSVYLTANNEITD